MDKNDHFCNDSDDDNHDKQTKKLRDNPLDWSKYMTEKRAKLFKQFNEDSVENNAENNGLNQLFSGVCVYINGVTNPPEIELKTLVLNSGGMYLNHLDPKRTTHTIADNLPLAKIKNLKANRIVVKPEWITDSIQAKQLLPVEDYSTIKHGSNLRQYLNKPIELSGNVIEDIHQIIDSNDGTDRPIDHTNDVSIKQLSDGPQITTTCEPVIMEDQVSNVAFNRSKYIPHSLEQIDPQFLDALPIELRNDILKDIDIQSNTINSENNEKLNKRKNEIKTNDSNKKVVKEWPKNDKFHSIRCQPNNCLNSGRPLNSSEPNEQIFGGLLTSNVRANICGKTDTTQVIQLIEEWVTTEEELIDEDIAYVIKYLCDLIDERKYNNLLKTFSKLFEYIERRAETVWKQCYNDIRNSIIIEIKTSCNEKEEQINNLPYFQIN